MDWFSKEKKAIDWMHTLAKITWVVAALVFILSFYKSGKDISEELKQKSKNQEKVKYSLMIIQSGLTIDQIKNNLGVLQVVRTDSIRIDSEMKNFRALASMDPLALSNERKTKFAESDDLSEWRNDIKYLIKNLNRAFVKVITNMDNLNDRLPGVQDIKKGIREQQNDYTGLKNKLLGTNFFTEKDLNAL
jgi:hypothetical protein